MTFIDILTVVVVLFSLFIIIYSKIKDKDLKDTLEEIKELINPVEVTNG